VRKTVRYAVAQGLAAGLILTLSACGGDPEPRFEEEPSPTPSEVTSSAPAKEAWEEKSDDGAVAFVEHWIDEFNGARSTGDTTNLVRNSTADCETCTNFVDLIDTIYEAGGSISTKGWRIAAVGQLPETGKSTVIPITVKQAPQEYEESEGAEIQRNPGGQVGMTATVTWSNGAWKMARLDLVQ
jgi:hypothetical protein